MNSKSKSLLSKISRRLYSISAIATLATITAVSLTGCVTIEESNQSDSVQKGTVVDKTHSEGHVYYTTSYTMNVPITKPNFLPGSYKMKIAIEENGQKTIKTIEVSKEEYNSYNVGDSYNFR